MVHLAGDVGGGPDQHSEPVGLGGEDDAVVHDVLRGEALARQRVDGLHKILAKVRTIFMSK